MRKILCVFGPKDGQLIEDNRPTLRVIVPNSPEFRYRRERFVADGQEAHLYILEGKTTFEAMDRLINCYYP